MNATDLLLACLALIVGVVLAWRSVPVVRGLVFASALVVSGLLFLPGKQLVAMLGTERVAMVERWAAATPWALSEWAHLLIFFWLAFLLWLGHKGARDWRGLILLVFLAVAAECVQALTPGREPRLMDVAVNLLGAALGVLTATALLKIVVAYRGRP